MEPRRDSSGKIANDDCSSNWLFLWLGKVGTKKKLPPCSMRLRHTQTVGIFEPCYYRASPRLQTQLLEDPYSSEASSLKAKQDSTVLISRTIKTWTSGFQWQHPLAEMTTNTSCLNQKAILMQDNMGIQANFPSPTYASQHRKARIEHKQSRCMAVKKTFILCDFLLIGLCTFVGAR